MPDRIDCMPLLAVLSLVALSGCAVEAGVYDRGGGPVHNPSENVNIPPGHMPPPGECRIWFPDRPGLERALAKSRTHLTIGDEIGVRENGIDPVRVTFRKRNATGQVVSETTFDTPRTG